MAFPTFHLCQVFHKLPYLTLPNVRASLTPLKAIVAATAILQEVLTDTQMATRMVVATEQHPQTAMEVEEDMAAAEAVLEGPVVTKCPI